MVVLPVRPSLYLAEQLYLAELTSRSHNWLMTRHRRPRLRLRLRIRGWVALLGVALWACGAVAGEKERLAFRAKPAEAYPARDAHEGLIAAAEPFETRQKAKPVFGKPNLAKAGILPVLVVIANTTDKTVRLDDLLVQLLTRDRQKIEPTPAEVVVQRLTGKGKQPRRTVPYPLPRLPGGSRANVVMEVLVHEFNMRLLPPESTASGFFYFEIGSGRDWLSGSKLYLTQLVWAHNSQPLMYFEISLDDALRGRPPSSSGRKP